MTRDIERDVVARLARMSPADRERELEQQSAFVADWLAIRARWIDRYVMTCSAQGAADKPEAIAAMAAGAYETRGHEDAQEAATARMASPILSQTSCLAAAAARIRSASAASAGIRIHDCMQARGLLAC